MGLAQARRPVDEQRVVCAGRIGRHRLGRRIGKLVGGTFDEILKGEIIPAAGQQLFVQFGFFLFLVLFRGNEHHVHVKAQHRFEGVLEHGGVPVRYNAQDKGVAYLQRDGVGIFKADRLDVADVILIGCLGSMFTAICLGRVQYVVDGIHVLRYSPLPVKNRALPFKGAKTLHTVYHKTAPKTTPYYKIGRNFFENVGKRLPH